MPIEILGFQGHLSYIQVTEAKRTNFKLTTRDRLYQKGVPNVPDQRKPLSTLPNINRNYYTSWNMVMPLVK